MMQQVWPRCGSVLAIILFLVCGEAVLAQPALGGLDRRVAGPGQPIVVAAAGDVVCGHATPRSNDCVQMETSDLVLQMGPDAVFVLGDVQYEAGEYEDFLNYYEPSWGRFRDISYPAAGNHEYLTLDASGYFDYWNGVDVFSGPAGDRDKGYYSFDLGAWHIVVLNSGSCWRVACGARSAQVAWLRADLDAHPSACTLAFWHHPVFSSGQHRGTSDGRAFWQVLYEHQADVVLVGHDHDYERFAPQTADGQLDVERGIREFVVGTGGKNTRPFVQDAPNSEVRDANTFGVLKLTLYDAGYDWEFVPIPGQTFTDSGSGTCHAAAGRQP